MLFVLTRKWVLNTMVEIIFSGILTPFPVKINESMSQRLLHMGFPMQAKRLIIRTRIAQLVAYQLGTGEVPGSNPGKGENY